MNIGALGTFEKDVLLTRLLHSMDMETRGKIMAEYPLIYAKMAPQTVTTVEAHVVLALKDITREVEDA
jgi:hypothetical protein